MNGRVSALGFLVVFGILGACSSDSSDASGSSSGASSGRSGDTPSCSDVCAAIAKQCGVTPESCSDICSSLADSTKSCITGASSCSAIDACGESSNGSSGTSGSSGSSGDICKSCNSSQFCVKSSSVEGEVGCVALPTDCNDGLCQCLIARGCSKGGKSCEPQGIVECL